MTPSTGASLSVREQGLAVHTNSRYCHARRVLSANFRETERLNSELERSHAFFATIKPGQIPQKPTLDGSSSPENWDTPPPDIVVNEPSCSYNATSTDLYEDPFVTESLANIEYFQDNDAPASALQERKFLISYLDIQNKPPSPPKETHDNEIDFDQFSDILTDASEEDDINASESEETTV